MKYSSNEEFDLLNKRRTSAFASTQVDFAALTLAEDESNGQHSNGGRVKVAPSNAARAIVNARREHGAGDDAAAALVDEAQQELQYGVAQKLQGFLTFIRYLNRKRLHGTAEIEIKIDGSLFDNNDGAANTAAAAAAAAAAGSAPVASSSASSAATTRDSQSAFRLSANYLQAIFKLLREESK